MFEYSLIKKKYYTLCYNYFYLVVHLLITNIFKFKINIVSIVLSHQKMSQV